MSYEQHSDQWTAICDKLRHLAELKGIPVEQCLKPFAESAAEAIKQDLSVEATAQLILERLDALNAVKEEATA